MVVAMQTMLNTLIKNFTTHPTNPILLELRKTHNRYFLDFKDTNLRKTGPCSSIFLIRSSRCLINLSPVSGSVRFAFGILPMP
jgi:hypothetical protein